MNRRTLPRLSPALSAIALIVFWSAGCGKGSSETGRPGTPPLPPPLPQTGFKAEITVAKPPATLKVSEAAVLDVTVKNLGDTAWPRQGGPGAANSVLLSYHWLPADGSRQLVDGLRTNLPSDLSPGTTAALRATVKAPDKPGTYILEFDMVQEAVDWFKNRGSKAVRFNVTVE
ncbi:MAG: hypothetical protein ACHQPI_04335 [Thermoanaerobaculia bacterium]